MGAQPDPVRPTAAVYGALLVQTVVSAGTYLVAKRALVELTPVDLVLLRFLLSGVIFMALLAVVPGPKFPPKKDWPLIAGLGIAAGPINQGALFYGLARSSPAHAALLYALTPMVVFAYGVARAHERLSRRVLIGIVIAFVGVVVLLLGRGLRAATGPLFGDLFIMLAVAAWAIYTAESKPVIARHGVFRGTAWTMVVAGILGVAIAPFTLDSSHVVSASRTTLFCIAYLAVLTSVVSYFLWYYALGRLAASKVAVFSNLQPVVTALAAWAFLGDPLTWEIGVGGVLVLAGVRFAQEGRAHA